MTSLQRERRAHARRHTANEHGIVRARVRPGHPVTLMDVSASGALIETNRRLLPDAFVEIHVETLSQCANVRGRVVRCAVTSVRPAVVRYRGAIQFDSYLPWFVEDEGWVGHTRGSTDQAAREDVTPLGV
jgi:PilZ domain